MGLKERAAERRKRIVGHVAHSHEEAEAWDIEFWQSQTPQELWPALAAPREGRGQVGNTSRQAERQDLELWQRRSPQERLSAATAIRAAVQEAMGWRRTSGR